MRIQQSRPAPGAVVGGVLVVLGTVLLLDRLQFIQIRDWFRYWPVLLILIGVVKVIDGPDGGARAFGGLLSGAGTVLLLNRLGLTNIRLFDLWPVTIIAVGVALLYNALSGGARWGGFGHANMPSNPNSGDSWIEFTTIFGGVEVRNNSTSFEGGNLTAIFGGIEVDLRRAAMAGDSAAITLTATFGGISLRVPENWVVVFQGQPIFGGYEDKTAHMQPVPGLTLKTLYLRGTAAFGGIEVKN
jgi:predicted membrane protein